MDIPASIYTDDHPGDADNTDALLELAETTRELIAEREYAGLKKLIAGTVENGWYEAFSWIAALLQEELAETETCRLESFGCDLGRGIGDFDALVGALHTDGGVLRSDTENVYDENGEVRSFFHFFAYKTMYDNIFLLSCESFDTLDNDYIRYMLLFVRDPAAPGVSFGLELGL